MVIAAGKISSLDLSETPLSDHSEALRRLYKTFASVKRGSWLITNSVSGSLVDVIMDYVRMLFHVDLIKFNTMRKTALDHSEEIDELYNTLGEIETCSCVAVFRESLNKFCLPEFSSDTDRKSTRLNSSHT